MIATLVLLALIFVPIVLMRESVWCQNVALGWDTLLSAMTGGKPGETLSGRAGAAYLAGKWRGRFWVPIIDWVMRKKGHCVGAVKGDELRAQAVLQDYARP